MTSIHAAQALFVYDRLARACRPRVHPALPEPLVAAVRAARRVRGSALRHAAAIAAETLGRRPFPWGNEAAALLLALVALNLNGVAVRVSGRQAEAALRRWSRRPPSRLEVESWLRRRAAT